MLSMLLDAGAEMDDEMTQAVFWTAVAAVEAAPEDSPPPVEVPRLLHHVFDADMRLLLGREKQATNVTCMQPVEEGGGYGVIDDDLVAVPLRPGRACEGGDCCEACSRVLFPSFTSEAEADAFVKELEFSMVEPFEQFSLQKCAFRDTRTTLIFVRLVERMRRVLAHEYGLPLSTVSVLQTFVACFMGANDKQGGLHSDESTHEEFHYSCVMYLTSQHDDFEGGTLHFSDPAEGATGERVLTPLSPTKGSAIFFSSGWENIHKVEPLLSGRRIAVPSFFTTQPPPEDADPPADDDAIAEQLWRTLIAPEAVADYRQFIMKWHSLLAPGR